MRVYVRTSRYSAISLGPVALLVIGPFIAAAWVLYVVALLVYYIGYGVVVAVEDVASAAARRQHHRQARRS